MMLLNKNKTSKKSINPLIVGAFTILLIILSISLLKAQPTTKTITSKIDYAEDCEYRWFCSNWVPEECPETGIQTRGCTNAGTCPDDFEKPEEKRGCEVRFSPAQLFDIKLELEENVIYDPGKLTAWVRFESFGTEPTPVDLNYVVLDKKGDKIYAKKESVTVETEKFVVERFVDLRLDYGKYTLVLTTIYNENVEDEFAVDFEIKNQKAILNYFIVGVSILIVGFLLLKFIRGKKK